MRLRQIFIALLLVRSLGCAFASIDMRVDPSNFSGQASEINAQGIVTPEGDSTAISGVHIVLKFDPTKLAITNMRAASEMGWAVQATNYNDASVGAVQAVLSNNNDPGQTATGPILYFTVTPLVPDLDLTDCATLRLIRTHRI